MVPPPHDSDAAAITKLQLVLATRPTLKISF
jgi:hypothetical protein